MMPKSMPRKDVLLVAGVHRSSNGYPNVLHRLEALKRMNDFEYEEINFPILRSDSGGFRLGRQPRLLARAFRSHLSVFLALMGRRPPDILYVPYPSIFVANILPRRMRRSRLVLDAFISIYETVVEDRKMATATGLAARVLYWLEARALRLADAVVVDTAESAAHFRELFRLEPTRFVAVPLSTNEQDYRPVSYAPQGDRTRVLFVGTLIPLHGIETIVRAAENLKDREDIEFVVVGDGQESECVRRAISSSDANIAWQRGWRSPAELADEIRRADICLGIFGKTAKAQRVCPLKIYAYASVGRPVITADTTWLRNAEQRFSGSFCSTVPHSDPEALAARIMELAASPAKRVMLAQKSREFYEMFLSNSLANKKLIDVLRPPIRA